MFFNTFTRSWAQATSGVAHPFLWNTEVDPVIVSHAFYPYDTAAVTVAKLHSGLRVDAWGGTGFLLRSDGSVVRADAVTQALGVIPSPTGECVAAGRKAASLSVALNHAIGVERWFGLISYRSSTGALVSESGGATVGFPKRSGTLLTDFPPTAMSSVGWTVPPGRSLCITGVTIVSPEPAASNAPRVHPLDAPQPPAGKIP